MKLQFNDKVYDILKWLCLIALPALSVLYSALVGVWGWPYAQEVATTINAVVVFVGALIGISTASYNKANGEGTRSVGHHGLPARRRADLRLARHGVQDRPLRHL